MFRRFSFGARDYCSENFKSRQNFENCSIATPSIFRQPKAYSANRLGNFFVIRSTLRTFRTALGGLSFWINLKHYTRFVLKQLKTGFEKVVWIIKKIATKQYTRVYIKLIISLSWLLFVKFGLLFVGYIWSHWKSTKTFKHWPRALSSLLTWDFDLEELWLVDTAKAALLKKTQNEEGRFLGERRSEKTT